MSVRKFKSEKKGSPLWMNTYGDMVTLLLCFFVLLFSMSNLDIAKFKAAMSSFANQIDILPGGEALTGEELITNGISQLNEIDIILENKNPTLEEDDDVGTEENEINKTEKIAEEIKEYFEEEGIESQVSLSYNSNFVKMTLPGEILFDLGKAEIKSEAKEVLYIIAKMIIANNYNEYDIQIDGHTDNLPINTIQYPNNWYLSAARAIAVGDVFINNYNFSPDKIACTGYGEYRAIADNNTEEGRAMNRRVEIKIIVHNEEVTDDISLNEE